VWLADPSLRLLGCVPRRVRCSRSLCLRHNAILAPSRRFAQEARNWGSPGAYSVRVTPTAPRARTVWIGTVRLDAGSPRALLVVVGIRANSLLRFRTVTALRFAARTRAPRGARARFAQLFGVALVAAVEIESTIRDDHPARALQRSDAIPAIASMFRSI